MFTIIQALSLVSGPFAPLVSEPGLPRSLPPGSRHTPATPSHPDRFSRYAAKRKLPGRPTSVRTPSYLPCRRGHPPGHGHHPRRISPSPVGRLVHSVNKGFATTVCLFPPLPRALTADPWTPSLRRATPAVWRPTTAEKRDWRSRHTATDRRQITIP
jgi:hypothetical protein